MLTRHPARPALRISTLAREVSGQRRDGRSAASRLAMTKWLAGFALVIAFGLPTCRSEAASSLPDSHDRALVSGLEARLPAFRVLETSAFGASLTQDAHACTRLLKSLIGAKVDSGHSALRRVHGGLCSRNPPDDRPCGPRHVVAHVAALGASKASPGFASLCKVARDGGEEPGRSFSPSTARVGLRVHAPPQPTLKGSQKPRRATCRRRSPASSNRLGSASRSTSGLPRVFANDDPPEQLASLAPTMRAFFVAAGASPSDARRIELLGVEAQQPARCPYRPALVTPSIPQRILRC